MTVSYFCFRTKRRLCGDLRGGADAGLGGGHVGVVLCVAGLGATAVKRELWSE